jgi:septal ring factor EnvC (AmiA/AmiB activator)
MKQFCVLGLAIMTLVVSACATRGYARRQAREVNDRLGQVQAQAKADSDKHDAEMARVDERITTTDNKLQAAATSAAQANASAAQANASAARADASAAQANASAARSEAVAVAAAAARERQVMAQATPPPAQTSSVGEADTSKLPTTLPHTGSPLPLIGLTGLLSLGAAGALRLLRV